MIWFGSSAGVALSNMFPEAKSVGAWLKHGWHVALAYVIGFFVMLVWWAGIRMRRTRMADRNCRGCADDYGRRGRADKVTGAGLHISSIGPMTIRIIRCGDTEHAQGTCTGATLRKPHSAR